MKLRKYWPALLVVALLIGPAASGANRKLSQDRVIELAKNDPESLLKISLDHFDATVSDYTGRIYKQERIKGKLGKEQIVEFKFIEKPYSIFMRWEKNAGKIDKLLYVENQNKNKMLIHPTGLLAFIKSVQRDPRDKEVMKSTLKPCTEFGLLKVMQRLIKEYDPVNGNPKITMKFVKTFEKDKRKYILLEQTFDDPVKGAIAKRMTIYDIELMLPTERQGYDSNGKLLYQYAYKELKFNTGLKDEDFTPKANGL